MVLTVPGRKTVYVHMRVRLHDEDDPTRWARDARGNAVYEDRRVAVQGCSVQPASSTETEGEQRTRVTALFTVYAPSSFPGGAIDSVEIDGELHEIVGDPQRWDHPRLGHVVVNVRKGGG